MKLSIYADMEVGRSECGGRVWDTVRLRLTDYGKDDIRVSLGETTAKVRRQDLIGLAANILIEAVRGSGEDGCEKKCKGRHA